MTDYEKLYKLLFNGITDIIEDPAKQNYGFAADKLKHLQMKAEEIYIDGEPSSGAE